MPNEKELLEILLNNRGIKKEDWDKFLNPSYEDHLYDPFLMSDMEKATVRIFEAIEAKEKIVIYSDYDCDGIPSAVMMYDFLQKIDYPFFICSHTKENDFYGTTQGTSFSYGVRVYIPDRHDEGYGLHHEAIEQFIKDEVKLLITFDLGITAIEEVACAQAGGIDVIITDHHLPRQKGNHLGGQALIELPRAYAILNPKVDDYPDKNLCGAGIAFKLIQALIKKYGEYWKINVGWEKWLLDMAGVATLADQVPLLGENRVLVYYGLKVLQKGRRLGLGELFRKAGTEIKNINEEDITFTLAPRINAASRMADPMQAFKVLATKDPVEAKTLADYLSKINDDRKIMVAHIMKEIKSNLKKREEKEIIVIGNPKWRIGVLGIVASKVVEEYEKPAFIWGSDGGGLIRGSCRSFGGLNLVETMNALPSESLIDFGGHEGAGGFSVSHEEIFFLEERLLSIFDNQTLYKENQKEMKIEAVISLDDVNEENFKIVKQLSPFGAGNPKPIFLLKQVVVKEVREFGKEKNHLELSFLNSRGRKIKAIVFFKTRESFKLKLTVGEKIDMVVSLEKNTFGGRNELRLRIVDLI